jgi:hypothetical protein
MECPKRMRVSAFGKIKVIDGGRMNGCFGPKASMADFVVSAIHAAPTQGGF